MMWECFGGEDVQYGILACIWILICYACSVILAIWFPSGALQRVCIYVCIFGAAYDECDN